MFAEECLMGQCELKADKKGRIIIPKWTNREVGEKLVIVKDDDFNVYRLYKEDIINQTFKDYKIKKEKANSQKSKKEIKKEELEFCKSIITTAILDRQGRFLIGTEEVIDKTLNAIGAGDHLILELKK